MPLKQNMANTKVTVSTGVTLDWDDALPTIPENRVINLSLNKVEEDEEDFFDNFDPEVERTIIKMHNRYFDKLLKHIEVTTPLATQWFDQKAPKPAPKPKAMPINTVTKSPFDSYWKFPCKPNGKEPKCKWTQTENQRTASYDPERFNTGILTGSRNNLLVLDVDVKDDGVREFRKYRREFGTPKTLTVATPRGGNHYYFKYSHADPDAERMIKSYLKNTTKFRGKGLDIRSEGGYVLGPPSKTEHGIYQVCEHYRTPIDMPITLITWLLEGAATEGATKGSPTNRKPATTQGPTTEASHDFDLSPELATEILNELEPKYRTSWKDWFLVTGIMKQHGLKEVWDQWSRQSPNYNQVENERIWQSSKAILDINYLICLLRKAGSTREFVTTWKPYKPVTQNLAEVKRITFNNRYVSEGLSQDTFDNHETIIIKSCTGTGKTTAIAQHMERYPESKFLSITTRMTLADQHQKSFRAIRMQNYQDLEISLYDAHSLAICLNSLGKLEALDEEDAKDSFISTRSRASRNSPTTICWTTC